MFRFLILSLLALIGCSHISVPDKPEPIRPADLRAFSYSTKEAQDVAWFLQVYDPTATNLKTAYTPGSPGGFEGPFSWRVRGDGRVIGFKALGKATELNIADRDIVHFFVDGKSKYYGPIIRRPSPRNPNITEYEGGDPFTLLTEAVIKNYALQDVNLIARDAVQLYKHPALKYDVGRFPLSGGNIQKQIGSVADLGQFLDGLAQSLGPNWSTGVDSDGYVFLRQPSGTLELNYVTDGFDDLAVDSTAIVTKSQVVVFTGQESPRADYDPIAFEPRPIVVTAQDALHSTYNATKAPVAFAGSEAFVESSGLTTSGVTFIDDPNNVLDNNDATFAQNNGTATGLMSVDLPGHGVFVVEVFYSLVANGTRLGLAFQRRGGSPVSLLDHLFWELKPTQSQWVRYTIPISELSAGVTVNPSTRLSFSVAFAQNAGDAKIYTVKFYELSPTISAYAQSLIKLPYITPGEVKIKPLTTDFQAYATMSNTPGDLSLSNIPVAMYEGTLSMQEKSEIVRFGSPTGAGEEAAESQRMIEVVQRQNRVGQQQTQALLLRR